MSSMSATHAPHATRRSFGDHLRHWRQHRRLSQLALAGEAQVSTRHLSYVETGRASPSRDMVLRLAQRLDVPLRERNAWLMAAGYAPMYREHALDDPAMATARAAVQRILHSHEPWPALAMDRHWNLVLHNRLVPLFLQGLPAYLLQPPVNVLRLSLHPEGLAPRIANLGQWRTHLMQRLRQQIASTGDEGLSSLLAELAGYPQPQTQTQRHLDGEYLGVLMPFEFQTDAGLLRLISTTTVFGSAVDITLQELALETFFPADEATAQALRLMAGAV